MAESLYALIRDDNIVDNVIVVDDVNWLDQYVTDQGYVRAVNVNNIESPVAPGYVYKHGGVFTPPETLDTDKTEITGDGNDTATVTFTDHRDVPRTTAKASVNGQESDLDLADGVGVLKVTSKNPGDTISIMVNGLGIRVAVT